ncbi:1797_t:CDS:2 [Scutellospora calospora]|uniref:1797_t:CDS:1 n=1 Tax=Scutellospora calospora TaxID=85575 RepID=A0ACA9JUE9_9GLOM|nr:1797_t:CDS:2 [Scutellospora calospora]
MSSSKFNANTNKRDSYNPRVKAKLNSKLLLNDENRNKLKSLLDNVVKQYICRSYRKKTNISNSCALAACYFYVGCLAFVTINICNSEICGISGYLKHSELCKISQPQNDLPYRLLPYIRSIAENLLNLNVSTTNILALNAKTVKNNVDINKNPTKNLDQFLRQNADQSELKDACLYYQLHTKETDRLKIIICNHEQQEYVWRYGYQNLILVDGTFGISKHKLLLFIIMVIDENNKGIPIAFIFFTPSSNNWLTFSRYDSRILECLFTIFRDKISDIYNRNQLITNPNATSVIFTPLIAITNTDIKDVLKETWEIDSEKKIVRDFIKEKKNLLESLYKAENISKDLKNLLNSGVKFLNYLKKQWATDILYIVLVYEVIPNILTLRKLAIDLEYEKAERRKELNIMDPLDLVNYEIEKITGKIYVQVESKTTNLVYTTFFLTYQEARKIQNANESTSLIEDSSNNSDEIDNKSEEDIDDDDKKKNNNNDFNLRSTSSREALNYIEQQIFDNILEPKKPTPSIVNIASLNIAAIYKQEFQNFLMSISRNLQTL